MLLEELDEAVAAQKLICTMLTKNVSIVQQIRLALCSGQERIHER
jgi:hypothetical protein